MSRFARTALAALTVIALAATGVTAEEHCRLSDPDDDGSFELCREQVWFKPAETKAGNLGALGLTGFPTWDGNEPTESVTEGAGGGYFGSPVADIVWERDPMSGVTFEGEFTGPIDSLLVDLHAFIPGNNATDRTAHGVRTELTIDGEPISAQAEAVTLVAEPDGDAVYRLRFGYDGILPELDRWVGTGPDTVHTLRLNVTPFFFGDEALYVYGTSEVPGGIVFNATPDELDGVEILPLY